VDKLTKQKIRQNYIRLEELRNSNTFRNSDCCDVIFWCNTQIVQASSRTVLTVISLPLPLIFLPIYFRRVRKITKNEDELRRVCPSACPHGTFRTPTGRIFIKFDIWVFFENPWKKIQILLKSDKNKEYFTSRPMYIFITFCSVILRMKNVSNKNCRECQNKHFGFSDFCLNRAVIRMM
jgi:hypothetical protein